LSDVTQLERLQFPLLAPSTFCDRSAPAPGFQFPVLPGEGNGALSIPEAQMFLKKK